MINYIIFIHKLIFNTPTHVVRNNTTLNPNIIFTALFIRYTNNTIKFFINNNSAKEFNIIKDLSSHSAATTNQPITPIMEKLKSYTTKLSIPLIDIPVRRKTLAIHLIYQSVVYLGVADLNHLLEFFSSSWLGIFKKSYYHNHKLTSCQDY